MVFLFFLQRQHQFWWKFHSVFVSDLVNIFLGGGGWGAPLMVFLLLLSEWSVVGRMRVRGSEWFRVIVIHTEYFPGT